MLGSSGEADIRSRLSVGKRNRFVARPEALSDDEFPGIDIRLPRDFSPALAKALMRGKLEARAEPAC